MSSKHTQVAWPVCQQPLPAPIKFDSLWCSEDAAVRVATIGQQHFVSIDGDNFCGPFKTFDVAKAYGGAGGAQQ